MAQNPHGTFVLQSFVRDAASPQEMDALARRARAAEVKNLIGNEKSVHVLIQMVKLFPAGQTAFIGEFVRDKCLELSKGKFTVGLV